LPTGLVHQAGYFDRNALVRFRDGQVGEFQIGHPKLYGPKR
jgi:hypothetical protein